jgi:hydroxymethylbilane synthase
MTYLIGTRGSLLALTQCGQVERQLRELTGENFELKILKTQGDQIGDKALWQVEGKNFFTKELDDALLAKEVDIVVHSLKDLGGDRPEEFSLAAITKRQYPHDILLIKKSLAHELSQKSELLVGTSSPRRISQLTSSLSELLPLKTDAIIKTDILRGNVNTRVQKLLDGHYDAITLALAGLERLAIGPDSTAEIERLLKDLTFFILPSSIFPGAAGQGALAIECRKSDKKLVELIAKLEHAPTRRACEEERKRFRAYGGGCHLAVGIHAREVNGHLAVFERGEYDSKSIQTSALVNENRPSLKGLTPFVGLPSGSSIPNAIYDLCFQKKSLTEKSSPQLAHAYMTSRYCVDQVLALPKTVGLWAAGASSAKLLAKNGRWVLGCADSFGEEEIKTLRDSKALNLMHDLKGVWGVFTNEDSHSELGDIVKSYEREFTASGPEFKKALESCQVFYWTSFAQYQAYCQNFPQIRTRHHACGLGKTYDFFVKNKVAVLPFITMNEFYNALKN